MALTPWLDGPFNSLWSGFDGTQNNTRCLQFELNASDCLEAYGRHHVNKKCIDYIDDLRECVYRVKQNMRIVIMREERLRQYRAGERKSPWATGPIEDAY